MPGLLTVEERVSPGAGPWPAPVAVVTELLAPIVDELTAWGPVELTVIDPAHVPGHGYRLLVLTSAPRQQAIDLASRLLGDLLADRWAWYDLDTYEAFDRRPPPPDDSSPHVEPDVRKVTFHRRLPKLPIADYRRFYRSHQTVAAEHHPNATRYRQNDVVASYGPAAHPFDGISELWYPTIDDVLYRHFGGPASVEVVNADVSRWIDVPEARMHIGRAAVWGSR